MIGCYGWLHAYICVKSIIEFGYASYWLFELALTGKVQEELWRKAMESARLQNIIDD